MAVITGHTEIKGIRNKYGCITGHTEIKGIQFEKYKLDRNFLLFRVCTVHCTYRAPENLILYMKI